MIIIKVVVSFRMLIGTIATTQSSSRSPPSSTSPPASSSKSLCWSSSLEKCSNSKTSFWLHFHRNVDASEAKMFVDPWIWWHSAFRVPKWSMSTGCPTSEGILEPANEDFTNPQTSEGTSFFAPNQWIELKDQLRKTYSPNCQFPAHVPIIPFLPFPGSSPFPISTSLQGHEVPFQHPWGPANGIGLLCWTLDWFQTWILRLCSMVTLQQCSLAMEIIHILGCSIAMLNCQTGETKRWVPVESLWLFLLHDAPTLEVKTVI